MFPVGILGFHTTFIGHIINLAYLLVIDSVESIEEVLVHCLEQAGTLIVVPFDVPEKVFYLVKGVVMGEHVLHEFVGPVSVDVVRQDFL